MFKTIKKMIFYGFLGLFLYTWIKYFLVGWSVPMTDPATISTYLMRVWQCFYMSLYVAVWVMFFPILVFFGSIVGIFTRS